MTLFISWTRMLVPGCFIIVYYVFSFEERDQRLNVGFTLVLSGGSWLSLAGFGCIVHVCMYSLMQSTSYLV